MKKFLIATSTLVASSLTSAMALDVTTTGKVEYNYTKFKTDSDTESQNAKLNAQDIYVKFAATGSANGLAYGGWVSVNTEKPWHAPYKAQSEIPEAGFGLAGASGAVATAKKAALIAANTTANLGYTQAGTPVFITQDGTNARIVQAQIGTPKPADSNNAKTKSEIWVKGAFGTFSVGQASDIVQDYAVNGNVKAARYEPGSHTTDLRLIHRTFYSTDVTRATYISPEKNGFMVAYTQAFKGNITTDKTQQAQGAKAFVVSYKTIVLGNPVKVTHAAGQSGRASGVVTVKSTEAGFKEHTYHTDVAKGVANGIETTIGKYTVGYAAGRNAKRHYQTNDVTGQNYGVRYNGGFYFLGYTVLQNKDTNTYAGKSRVKAQAKTISGTVFIDRGFRFYASRTKNTVNYSDATKGKNTFLTIGIQANF